MNKNEWFASWFDTPFYHLLYRSRSEEEAQHFITQLIHHLKISENANVLDLACGKGRHARTLNALGLNVLGVDLSPKSISFAQQFENETLKFTVHDMRLPLNDKKFDAIFNLFTSFGYFDEDSESEKVLNGVSQMLKNSGLFVFDFLNLNYTLNTLVAEEKKTIDGVEFSILRSYDGRFIRKKIDVLHEGKLHHYEEKVRGFSPVEIEKMMHNTNLKPIEKFGDFHLGEYDAQKSDRLIFVCKKMNTV